MDEKTDLLDLSLEELHQFLTDIGYEEFRAKQITNWLYRGIRDIDGMTNIPKELRNTLKQISYIGNIRMQDKYVSKDGTTKYLFTLSDGNIIESVLMKYKHGLTVCISSQIGCKMGCRFCASTGLGFVRNLTSGEMINQILSIQTDCGSRVGNIVIMGIGEPLDNYDNVIKFIRQANMPEGLNISYRKITISTCGLVPEILKLSNENIPVNLSISLHSPNDEKRLEIMPINKIYSIDKIIEACKIYSEKTKRRITFEYAICIYHMYYLIIGITRYHTVNNCDIVC
jgi:23S rRNA (adenine2503-C2)-methyltransferase